MQPLHDNNVVLSGRDNACVVLPADSPEIKFGDIRGQPAGKPFEGGGYHIGTQAVQRFDITRAIRHINAIPQIAVKIIQRNGMRSSAETADQPGKL